MSGHYSSDIKGKIPTSDNTAYAKQDGAEYEVVLPEKRELP